MTEFDLKKPVGYVETDGQPRPARIIATDARGQFSIVALVRQRNGDDEYAQTFDMHGSDGSGGFLVNVAPRHGVWLNWYRLPNGRIDVACYLTREAADLAAAADRIACTFHEITEGEGL